MSGNVERREHGKKHSPRAVARKDGDEAGVDVLDVARGHAAPALLRLGGGDGDGHESHGGECNRELDHVVSRKESEGGGLKN